MMNFRKIAAPSKGRLVLRYFTEDKPEPIHPPALDEAGRQLEEGGRLVAYYTGRDSRVSRRHRRGLVAAQAQAQRLRLGVLVAQVGQSRQRVRRNAGRERAIWNAFDRASDRAMRYVAQAPVPRGILAR